MKTELKSCPWCGEIPELWQAPKGNWYIDCRGHDCGVNPGTDNYLSKENAIKIWNSRHDAKEKNND